MRFTTIFMPIIVLLERCRTIVLLALWCVLAVYLAFFAAHVIQMLAYPFPLDYGEGPLLAQIERLRAGTPIWQLYSDPAEPPYLVVNYPPVYLLSTVVLSFITGNILVAGRLISLAATLGSVWALVVLTADGRRQTGDGRQETQNDHPLSLSSRPLSPVSCLIFLSIPVVREWAGYLRVDALALCLGLWGLVVLTGERRRTNDKSHVQSDLRPSSFVFRPLVAGLLLVLALYTKPSMVAAPVAGGVWWLLAGRAEWRLRLLVVIGWAAFALVPLALLQWASGGWFWLHVFTANTNRWDAGLAQQFWGEQIRLRWPLAAAAFLGCCLLLSHRKCNAPALWWVPLLYTAIGVLTALGVGKVGAYANYFLELYAGLVWIACYSLQRSQQRGNEQRSSRSPLAPAIALATLVLLVWSMLYYLPMWSRDTLRAAGLLEPNPPQLFFRRSTGLWRETTREAEVLAAQRRVQAAITSEAQATGGPIFTDTPGIAAQTGVLTPLQAFEHRQLLDSGHWDQRPILRDLANGVYPLAPIDFLGNWLTPEMVNMLIYRYAQDGAFGTFDMYRPVATGKLHAASIPMGDIVLGGYRLVSPGDSSDSYSPGELLTFTTEWTRPAAAPTSRQRLEVVVQLQGADGVVLQETRPLIYGALPPEDWLPGVPVQHMQPFTLPDTLTPGSYTITVGLRNGEKMVTPAQSIASITTGTSTGRTFETGWNVPAPILAAWNALGGIERAGLPLTPAVPFAWGRLQCFEYLCLEQHGAEIVQRPLGEQHFLAETIRGEGDVALHEPFLSFWRARGGESSLGPPISGEALRNAYIVQWTRYARLERHPETGALGLGRLGDDSLRLSPGMRYRWPSRGNK